MDYDDAQNGGLPGAHCNPARSIIGAEDEDFENDLYPTVDDQFSHFNSIELLKSRPTHLMVFLHHVILQFDCAPLLSYLHADLFKSLSAKESKKQFVEFYTSFLDKGAILRVSVPLHISSELDRTRPDLISEDLQKRFVQEIQNLQSPEVFRQLDDFRKKRMMGMTPNEFELNEVENHYPTDRVPRDMKEKAVAERLLEKLFENNPTISADEDKGTAIFSAVTLYMKHLGVKSRAPDSKKSRGFFKRKVGKKDETKGIRGILTEAGRLLPLPSARGNEIRRIEHEGDRDKTNKGSLVHRGSSSDGSVAPVPSRKHSVPPGSTVQSPEGNEVTNSNVPVTPIPEPSINEQGPSTRTSELQSVSDGGDVSPAGIGITVWDPPAVNDIPVEETHEKDNADIPLFPVDGLPSGPSSGTSAQQEEVEPRLLELEQDPPNWRELASSEALSKLSKKEMKRQEVINELFATEHAHVRMLSVLQTVFAHPLEREEIMNSTELNTIFPCLDEIIELHYAFYENLKKLRQEDNYVVKNISTPLLNRFNGSEGEWFQKLTARFCSHQSWTLVQIKNKQKRDQRFNSFILEAESKPQCRRLQLKDIIPIEMQRLTKYPLLLENIAKCTEDIIEKENIQQAAECCRKILNHVNEEVKLMENLLTLKDYQRRLDTSGLKPSTELYTEYKSLDMTLRNMIYEGSLTWRVTKEKALDVQAVLLGDLLVLLQKQDDKMLLKCQSKSNITLQEGKQMLSPIIKLESAFLREVATDRKAFYVIFTWESGAQIYELVAQSVAECRTWTESIKSAVDELKKNGGSTLDRKRLNSTQAGGSGLSQSLILHPPLSPTENGPDPLKNNMSQDKDSLTDKVDPSQTSLFDYLASHGFDPLGYSNTSPERTAAGALDEVLSLRIMLVGDSGSSDEVKPDGESSEEPVEDCSAEGQEDREAEKTGRLEAPLMLSQERVHEVFKKLNHLENQLNRLKNVEDEYHKLQGVLAKFSLRGDYN